MTPGGRGRVGVIIVAAGRGRRFGDESKVLASLCGRPVLWYSLDAFRSTASVREIVVVAGAHTLDPIRELLRPGADPDERVCLGGETRSESVRRGFDALSRDLDIAVVHDAARPLLTVELAMRVISAAEEHGASAPALPVSDTICRVDDRGLVAESVARDTLRTVQTPQAARRPLLEEALRQAETFTDESSALLAAGVRVNTVDGMSTNIKLTRLEDLALAEAILRERRG